MRAFGPLTPNRRIRQGRTLTFPLRICFVNPFRACRRCYAGLNCQSRGLEITSTKEDVGLSVPPTITLRFPPNAIFPFRLDCRSATVRGTTGQDDEQGDDQEENKVDRRCDFVEYGSVLGDHIVVKVGLLITHESESFSENRSRSLAKSFGVGCIPPQGSPALRPPRSKARGRRQIKSRCWLRRK